MFYCGIKREVHFAGWMTSSRYPDIKQAVEPEHLQAVMQQAREDTLAAIAGIREGNIVPKPADELKCDYCEFPIPAAMKSPQWSRRRGPGNEFEPAPNERRASTRTGCLRGRRARLRQDERSLSSASRGW